MVTKNYYAFQYCFLQGNTHTAWEESLDSWKTAREAAAMMGRFSHRVLEEYRVNPITQLIITPRVPLAIRRKQEEKDRQTLVAVADAIRTVPIQEPQEPIGEPIIG